MVQNGKPTDWQNVKKASRYENQKYAKKVEPRLQGISGLTTSKGAFLMRNTRACGTLLVHGNLKTREINPSEKHND